MLWPRYKRCVHVVIPAPEHRLITIQFTALLGVTIPTDLYWVLLGADLSWFAVLLSLVLIVLKASWKHL